MGERKRTLFSPNLLAPQQQYSNMFPICRKRSSWVSLRVSLIPCQGGGEKRKSQQIVVAPPEKPWHQLPPSPAPQCNMWQLSYRHKFKLVRTDRNMTQFGGQVVAGSDNGIFQKTDNWKLQTDYICDVLRHLA